MLTILSSSLRLRFIYATTPTILFAYFIVVTFIVSTSHLFYCVDLFLVLEPYYVGKRVLVFFAIFFIFVI